MIEHIESVTKVYQTTNYGIFTMVEGNRLLNERKINTIISDINNGFNLLPFFPILVSRDLKVLDGQHRLYIAKKLKLPIHYIISTRSISIEGIAKINSKMERWKAKDFLNCYVRQGNVHYIQIQKLMDTTGVKLNVAVQLLSKGDIGDSGGNRTDKRTFESGRFIAHDYDKVIYTMSVIEKHLQFFERRKTRQFLVGFIPFFEEHKESGVVTLSRLLQKNPEELERLNTTNIKYYFNRFIKENF